jgi:ATP-dependent RNA helicase RhlE
MSFSTIGLCETILKGAVATGYTTPTKIQAQAIPLALQGRDIIGCAPTGTGKTAAFMLPILDRLERSGQSTRGFRHPRALILTPTRELAQQIDDCSRTYSRFTRLSTTSVYGGVNINGQFRNLDRGVDIVIACPGRLIDHLERGSIDLSCIEVLVLDEADRMFDMGFIQAVRRIIAKVPRQRQTLLFSATMTREVRELIAGIQKNPHLIEIGEPFKPVESVTQHFYRVPQRSKIDLLMHVLDNEEVGSMLVFTRTKHGADALARRLATRKGLPTATLHSNRSQSQRQRALDGFKQGHFKVLVATDIAGRGIDVADISHVVNYDIPAFAEDYIHRIGRTGRAQARGVALSFAGENDLDSVRKIEKFTGKRCELKQYPGFQCGEVCEPLHPGKSQPAASKSFGRPRVLFDGFRSKSHGSRRMQRA